MPYHLAKGAFARSSDVASTSSERRVKAEAWQQHPQGVEPWIPALIWNLSDASALGRGCVSR